MTVMASLGPGVSHRLLKALRVLSWKRSLGVGHEIAFVKYVKESHPYMCPGGPVAGGVDVRFAVRGGRAANTQHSSAGKSP